MKRSCKSILEDDNNVQIEDPVTGLKTVQVEILEKLCVNDCSGNGACNQNGYIYILIQSLAKHENS